MKRTVWVILALASVVATAVSAFADGSNCDPQLVLTRFQKFRFSPARVGPLCQNNARVKRLFQIQMQDEEDRNIAVSACEANYHCISKKIALLYAAEKKRCDALNRQAAKGAPDQNESAIMLAQAKTMGTAAESSNAMSELADQARGECAKAISLLQQVADKNRADNQTLADLIRQRSQNAQQIDELLKQSTAPGS